MADLPRLEIYVGHESPDDYDRRRQRAPTAGAQLRGFLELEPHPLSERTFPWPAEVQPRWVNEDSSGCTAAIDPPTSPDEGIGRYLSAARARGEQALIVIETGYRRSDSAGRLLGVMSEATTVFPGSLDLLSGDELPPGVRPRISANLSGPDRDLALRLRNSRSEDWPWFSLQPPRHPPRSKQADVPSRPEGVIGTWTPLLVDETGATLAAVWTPPDADASVYVIPRDSDWRQVIGWIAREAVPALVPAAARRARALGVVADELLTNHERAARDALNQFRDEFRVREAELDQELATARDAAASVRDGLLYSRGDAMKQAVSRVLVDAGFQVEDLDKSFSGGQSGDLLASRGGKHWLVECRGTPGTPGEETTYDVKKHVATWSQLGRTEPLAGGVFVVSHNLRNPDPLARPAAPFQREAFVRSLDIAVIDSAALFLWWAAEDIDKIASAVTGGPGQHGPR